MSNRRYAAYATLTEDEHERVQQVARQRGLTVAELVRRAVNYVLVETDEDLEPLEERKPHGGPRKRQHAA